MDQQQYIRFWPFLQEVPDPRDRKGRRYTWSFLLALICIALASGQKQVYAIAHWCHLHGDELRAILPDSSSRVPSPSTFYRVLRQVDIAALEARVSAYGQACLQQAGLLDSFGSHGCLVGPGRPSWTYVPGPEAHCSLGC